MNFLFRRLEEKNGLITKTAKNTCLIFLYITTVVHFIGFHRSGKEKKRLFSVRVTELLDDINEQKTDTSENTRFATLASLNSLVVRTKKITTRERESLLSN